MHGMEANETVDRHSTVTVRIDVQGAPKSTHMMIAC